MAGVILSVLSIILIIIVLAYKLSDIIKWSEGDKAVLIDAIKEKEAMKEVELDLIARRNLIKKICKTYGKHLNIESVFKFKYADRLRLVDCSRLQNTPLPLYSQY